MQARFQAASVIIAVELKTYTADTFQNCRSDVVSILISGTIKLSSTTMKIGIQTLPQSSDSSVGRVSDS